MEELEDEPDLLAAETREPVLGQRRDVHAVDDDLPGRRRVEAGEQAEQRGFAAARRSDDRDELTRLNRVVERMENRERVIAALNRFGDVPQLDHRAAFFRSAARGEQRLE